MEKTEVLEQEVLLHVSHSSLVLRPKTNLQQEVYMAGLQISSGSVGCTFLTLSVHNKTPSDDIDPGVSDEDAGKKEK